MTPQPFPAPEDLTICFAHVAYQLDTIFARRQSGLGNSASTGQQRIRHFQAWNPEDLAARLQEADVLLVSGFWQNELLDVAPRLRFIQSIGAGVDQFDLDALRQRGIRLATASGVNSNAVSEHAMALILAFTRHIHTGRDRQQNRAWRGMIGDLTLREDELGGKTLLIIGLGKIGSRLAKLAKAFDMRVLATKRNPATAAGPADAVHTPDDLPALLPQADFVALTCPLTPDTENVIDAPAFAQMKESAYLINVARGGCVDEPAMLTALQSGAIAGAGIDHFWEEPLPQDSPFWGLENVLITPHTGGETCMYEQNLIDILLENLDRLWRGEKELQNQVV
ncbi:MAG: D-2-hydroxyacid dehydrogenase [Caldilineaceae bacterium SB0664_bin_27]|uniref:D-2-hydroxyacid dehydrogenase n=1 Tax=Caldilineaceae bacterium SB0664_bin_27 TaxID=2605260 RepID=A0A6B0YX27_9CHLR|nr:D-2-hydroxyacid dehydrogenase [Caldilineaceae bacterium SB0664_bin_27]